MMKSYDVYFHIKANNTVYANKVNIVANTAAEAKTKCVPLVENKIGKHPFHVSTKPHADYGKSEEYPIKWDN